MKVRSFIESYYKGSVQLKRLANLKFAKEDGTILRRPYLECRNSWGGFVWIEITEEEATLLSSRAGRQAYNIDCSIWDTYRYLGEID